MNLPPITYTLNGVEYTFSPLPDMTEADAAEHLPPGHIRKDAVVKTTLAKPVKPSKQK
jgi:hypothetical protein